MDSPCVDICVLDHASGLCSGCGRTVAEIASWASISPAERRAIMAKLADRLNAGVVDDPATGGGQ